MAVPAPSRCPATPAASQPGHTSQAAYIIINSLAPSTRQGYKRAIQAYTTHAQAKSTQPTFPARDDTVISFICHMHQQHYAPATITTYISALSFVNKMFGRPPLTQTFLINKLLEGCRKLNPKTDTRRPITTHILRQLLAALHNTQRVHYNRVLLTAMWLLAFHGFLRIGEISARSQASSHIPLQLNDCSITKAAGKLKHMDIHIQGAKHSKGQSFHIQISATNTQYCPVLAMHNYLTLAKPTSGPLFQFPGPIAVTRHYFDQQLHLALQSAGYDTKTYKGHSFRIGAASEAVATLGLSEHQVQKLGRWKSDAFKSYIRIPQFKV